MKSLLNPWAILAVLVLILGAAGSGYWRGAVSTRNAMEAATAREERIGQIAYQKAQEATADAIANLRINNTTIRQTLEKEVRYEIDPKCIATDTSIRLLNDTLTQGQTGKSVDRVELPKPNAVSR